MDLKRLAWPFTGLCHRYIGRTRRYDPSRNLYVFTEPRGGGTWLTELLKYHCSEPVLWEPVNPRTVPELVELGVGWRQHIPRDADWPEFKRLLKRQLAGEYVSYNSYSRMTVRERLRSSRFLVKFCRANGFLGWFVRVFQPIRQPVYLVRNPFAVIASQLRHGAWDQVGTQVRTSGRYDDRFTDVLERVGKICSIEEKLMVNWCRANACNLSRGGDDEAWIKVHYEDLVLDPGFELRRIWSAWGWEWQDEILGRVRKPSATVSDEGLDDDRTRQLNKWRQEIDHQLLPRLDQILDAFGLESYSSDHDSLAPDDTNPSGVSVRQ